ncbi:4a-hydroxytetrahydrobiopterin dehydratase [Streptomyces rubiginosohelvolus]|uniref:Putative pterin-4-alpha-carbinolamine dehydratase n=2 Tax=Streptomyces rubiginosohelvolus TaxID=67362 RepID=A0ABQ3BTG3_9ACTN|nr:MULTISPECIES: 4a-hydroxytetrahydrobiopterin dehydratase [Streptomyces]NED07645.1 4a-hydroxytetrahydrobiopterin dehydratase [Streptomyces sp. SID6648]NEE28057.1 4a-hydroxytetrahydrobiopterin dehydratase [Streptomyces sp. SID7982]MBK3542316.1 4a-hydroxytetrahydrobiopterin dehydratase [Streptomyces sp. MBT60]MCA1272670.1 4a-hydroxytetrahydrobiopterin dehydratase [Streptomyces sp. 7G]MZG04588.1 4a-hydroxytetrahydrobiopterin dehydratase [Streptomyces sp. SID5614]
MSAEPLSPSETEIRLESLPGWALEGDRITRTFRLPSHFAAAALTVHIAQIQDELNHHSDLTLGYNTVALAVHTHSAGGAITEKDLALAARVAAAAPAHGAE